LVAPTCTVTGSLSFASVLAPGTVEMALPARPAGGSITVENRAGPLGADGEPRVLGARFIVRLPAL